MAMEAKKSHALMSESWISRCSSSSLSLKAQEPDELMVQVSAPEKEKTSPSSTLRQRERRNSFIHLLFYSDLQGIK